MWNDSSNYKKIIYNFTFIFIVIVALFCSLNNYKIITFSTGSNEELESELSDNITSILDKVETSELDDFLPTNFNLNFFDVSSFKSIATKVLNGTYFDEYDSLLDGIKDIFLEKLESVLMLFSLLLVIVVLYELFKNFCVDKYSDFKKSIKLIFSFILILILTNILKTLADNVFKSIDSMFSFSRIFFPILLTLVLTSGAVGTHGVYNSLSLFLLNTGSYIFVYVLVPLSVSILLLSVFGSVFSSDRFSKVIDICKSAFKYVIAIFFSVFGIFSTINLITSGVRDGVSLKLTKFAIKNYVPIVGGYISDGFDFVHTCSVLVKNAFGVCGILILLFIIINPLIEYFVYLILFKLLSAVVALIGNNEYSNLFDNVSKSISYFLAVLLLLFFIIFAFVYLLIISVSVV